MRAWEHHSGHLSVVAFLGLGMWSWADADGFTAAVVEHWLSCDTCPDREMWNVVLKLQMESLAITGLNHEGLVACMVEACLSQVVKIQSKTVFKYKEILPSCTVCVSCLQ